MIIPPDASMPILVDRLSRLPTHRVLRDLTEAAESADLLAAIEFRKLVSSMLELADGRDRREPWTTRPGDVRPVPRLRLAIEACFGIYGDVHWFHLNKSVNASGMPLLGLFPRIAASLGRVTTDDFAAVVTALLSSAPDAALLKLLQPRGGKIRGMGPELFSRLAYAYRPDLFFVIPRPWGETSGAVKYIGADLRKYCGFSRNLRAVCDELGYEPAIRGALLDRLLRRTEPPAALVEALTRSLGPALARFSALAPEEAYEPGAGDDLAGAPLEFAAAAVRARRGDRDLRRALLEAYGDRCALTGSCLPDLLETAPVLPWPTGEAVRADAAVLLRSDVHTLWDLNLIGVEAGTGRVHVAPRLAGTIYERLAGRGLLARADGSSVSPIALAERWRLFAGAHPDAVSVAPERAVAPGRRREAPRADDPAATGSFPPRGAVSRATRSE